MKSLKKITILMVILLTLGVSQFASAFVVKNIRVEGLQRISEGTVLNYLPVQIGQNIRPEDTANIIRALYKTGFFTDVSLDQDASTLIVKVKEKPTIGSIKFNGNKSIPTKQLRQTLKGIGFSEGQVFDRSTLDKIQDSLQREYYNRGNYNAKVTTVVTPEASNRVAININVFEGPSAKISKITILGNKAYTDKQLLKQFKLSKTHFYSFITSSDKFSQEKLDGDLESLKTFYMDRGYVEFKVDSYEVTLTPDKKHVNIIIHVVEGAQYKISGYKLTGEFVVPKENLEKLINIKPGEVFSRKKITAITQIMGNYLGNFGYTFARVQPIPEIDEKKKEVFITFLLNSGNRYYVRKINFHGNTKTEDVVLRREMRQQEGAVYSLGSVKESERNLNLLGYFKNVAVNNKKVPGTDDQVDLDYNVVEAPSATLTAGAGYSNTLGWLINGSYQQPNFLGTGKSVGMSASTSEGQQSASFNYFNPYYTDDGVGRGFNLYGNRLNTDDTYLDSASYKMDDYGANVVFSVPVTEHNTLSFTAGYGVTLLDIGDGASDELVNFADDYSLTLPLARANCNSESPDYNKNLPGCYPVDPVTGQPIDYPDKERYHNVNLTSGWGYMGYDRAIFPTKGFAQSTSVSVALPAGGDDMSYYKANYLGHFYQPLFGGYILSLRGEVGYGNGLGSTQYLPFYQNYGAGGIGITGAVRGYDGFSIGPKDSNGATLGGNLLTDGTVELIIPSPITPDSLRLSTFVDFGNVYNTTGVKTTYPSGTMRYSAGLQAEWRTPMGAIVMSLAKPLNKQKVKSNFCTTGQNCATIADSTEVFQFSVGTTL